MDRLHRPGSHTCDVYPTLVYCPFFFLFACALAQNRAFVQLRSEQELDVFWSMTSTAREQGVITVPQNKILVKVKNITRYAPYFIYYIQFLGFK